MKKKWLILICCVLFLFNAHAQSCRYLIWSDEFDVDGAPNPVNWGYDLGYIANNEFQTYTNSLDNARVENGKLIIEARKDVSGNWTSARLQTQNKHPFTHGRIEFKAKVPIGDGTWPALWMLGQSISTISWPGCGEIDIMESVGKDPGINHASIHTPSSYGSTVNTATISVTDYSTAFHIYAIEWTSTEIAFYVDDTKYYTYSPSIKNAQTWPFDDPCFIIMNVAMGGTWGSVPKYETNGLKNGIDPALTSVKMEVEYVRVYSGEIPQITGNKQATENTSENYSVPAMDATTYLWGVPDGATISSGQGTNAITVLWGANSGNITLTETQSCGTTVVAPLAIVVKTVPNTDTYEIPNLDNLGNNLWVEVPTIGNAMTFTITPDFQLNYTITSPITIPTINHPLTIINLTNYKYITLNLKTDKSNPPSVVRLDLIDNQGRSNLEHLLNITDFPSDDNYHLYSSEIANSADFDLSSITGIKMYVNYGFYGVTSINKLWFQNIILNKANPLSVKVYKDNGSYKVFPNPTTDMLSIEPYNNILSVSIINMVGQSIDCQMSTSGTLNVNTLKPGIYSLIILDKQHKKFTVKFEKK